MGLRHHPVVRAAAGAVIVDHPCSAMKAPRSLYSSGHATAAHTTWGRLPSCRYSLMSPMAGGGLIEWPWSSRPLLNCINRRRRSPHRSRHHPTPMRGVARSTRQDGPLGRRLSLALAGFPSRACSRPHGMRCAAAVHGGMGSPLRLRVSLSHSRSPGNSRSAMDGELRHPSRSCPSASRSAQHRPIPSRWEPQPCRCDSLGHPAAGGL
jgi:hypothetical protein